MYSHDSPNKQQGLQHVAEDRYQDQWPVITINGRVIYMAPYVMDLPASKSLLTCPYKLQVRWYFYVHVPHISKPAWLSGSVVAWKST